MSTEVVRLIQNALENTEWGYYRLILLSGGTARQRTQILAALSEKTAGSHVMVGIALSERLLGQTAEERRLHAPDSFHRLLAETEGNVVCIDRIEVLFDPTLSLDPLELLKHQSRNRTLVVSWCGHVDVDLGRASYAVPDHPEYCEGDVRDLQVIAVPQHTA